MENALNYDSINRTLNPENFIYGLTERDVLFLTKELKSKLQNLYKDREIKGNFSKACYFKDLNIKEV